MKSFLKKYKGEVLYSSSNFVVPLIGFLASTVAAACIVPEQMGIYQSILILLTYLNFLHIGVFQGLNRNISFYKAQNKLDKVQEQVNTSNTVAHVVSLIGLIVGLSTFFYLLFLKKDYTYLLAAILLTVNLVVIPIKTHIEATFRSSSDFGLLGKIVFKESLIYGLFSLLPLIIGYYGKIIADIIKAVTSLFFRKKRITMKATGRGNKKDFFELVKVGFPILIAGFLWGVFVIVDQTYIALYFNKFELGVYTLSRLIISALILIPNTVGVLLYPKISGKYGETKKASSLRLFWKQSILLTSVIIAPIILLAYFALPYLVETFMVNYSEGLPSAMVNLLSGATFVFMAPSVILGVLKHNRPYLITLGILLLVFWSVCLFFKEYFNTLINVAYLKLLLSLVLALFVSCYTYYITSEKFDSK